ncbi:hypothetical protein DSECCO2_561730 [anaerobic digester metagenome]
MKTTINNFKSGFTLIEVISVVFLLSIISVAALVRYFSLLDNSRLQVATALVASAQSQLTLEYSRRSIVGETFAIPSQEVCDYVSLSSSGVDVTLTCSGNLSGPNVTIGAMVDGQSFSANWYSPGAGP